MNYQDLGMRVKVLRRQMGFTQEELAKAAGISASFLGHIERGSRVASLETLVALCNTLRIAPEYFLQASLEEYEPAPASDLEGEDRDKLGSFLRMAEGVVSVWEDE